MLKFYTAHTGLDRSLYNVYSLYPQKGQKIPHSMEEFLIFHRVWNSILYNPPPKKKIRIESLIGRPIFD